MTTLDLTVRYFQDSTPAGVACREEHFRRREVSMALLVAQTALVLVDIWNTHFIESWRERAEHVTVAAIVPVLAAARQVGLTIVHAPSVRVAEWYPQVQCYRVRLRGGVRSVVGVATASLSQPHWPVCRLPQPPRASAGAAVALGRPVGAVAAHCGAGR